MWIFISKKKKHPKKKKNGASTIKVRIGHVQAHITLDSHADWIYLIYVCVIPCIGNDEQRYWSKLDLPVDAGVCKERTVKERLNSGNEKRCGLLVCSRRPQPQTLVRESATQASDHCMLLMRS